MPYLTKKDGFFAIFFGVSVFRGFRGHRAEAWGLLQLAVTNKGLAVGLELHWRADAPGASLHVDLSVIINWSGEWGDS